MNLQMTDTKSLADWIMFPDSADVAEDARTEWVRRFGVPFPGHPSYSSGRYQDIDMPCVASRSCENVESCVYPSCPQYTPQRLWPTHTPDTQDKDAGPDTQGGE